MSVILFSSQRWRAAFSFPAYSIPISNEAFYVNFFSSGTAGNRLRRTQNLYSTPEFCKMVSFLG